jgi:choline-sulfatase
VTAMDFGVGRILEELETMGVRDSTLVFFTGDNGMNMGHHGIYGKGNGTFPQNMYDTSVKVPAIFRLPKRIPAGVLCRDLLSHYDFLPTLLDFLGIDNPLEEELPGRSFASLLRGRVLGEKPVVVFDEYGPVRMIRSERWKYVHRYPYGPHELFDLKEDPEERRNLYGKHRYRKRIAQLKGELDSWFLRYVDPALDGSREGVTGKGQLGFAGLAGGGQKVWADDWHYLGEGPSKGLSVIGY